MKKHIFLIGFMGVGKSTVSRKLKELATAEEIAMDAVIVRENKMTVREMFERQGEAYFGDKETELLRRIAGSDPLIVS